MNHILIFGLIVGLVAVAACCGLGWQLLRQNGRILLRMETLEKRLDHLGPLAQGEGEVPGRETRFSDRSLTHSKIKRDGLKAGTVAPEFRVPRLDGGELALSDLRGRFVLVVFSSPHCGPCNTLAPKLEKFHRKLPELELVMISQGELEDNRAKVKEHGLTFPVLLQKQWEVSRDYAYFATPVAYLIDNAGVIAADVAVGVDGVLDLMAQAKRKLREKAKVANRAWLRRCLSALHLLWPAPRQNATLMATNTTGMR